MDTVSINKLQYLIIGVQGENAANNIPIDMTPWVEEFPNARFHLLFKAYNTSSPLPMVTTYDAETHILTWTPTLDATQNAGVGYTEIRAIDHDNGVLKKSRIVPTTVENSVTGVEGGTVPEPYEDWVNLVLGYKDDAEDAQEAAETAQGKAEDAQAAAEEASRMFDEADAVATTLPEGSSATVSVTQVSGHKRFNFGIPKGDTGSVENVYATTVPMSPQDSTKVATKLAQKADKVESATAGNIAAIDENGNLTDSGKTLGSSVPADAVFTDTIIPLVQLGNCFSLADLKTAIKAISLWEDNIANIRAGIFFTDESLVEYGTYYGTAYRVSNQTNYRRYEILVWGSETMDSKLEGSVVHITYDENNGSERWEFRKLAYDKDKISNNEIGIVVNGSKASVNVPEGQYVIVRNSTISGISDGLYKAASNVSAGSSFVAANLTSCSSGLGGEVSSLSDQIASIEALTNADSLASLDAVKTFLLNCANSISTPSGHMSIAFYNNFSDSVFTSSTYFCGTLYKLSGSDYFSCLLVSLTGMVISVGKSSTNWNFLRADNA